jgi:hypothetical protein
MCKKLIFILAFFVFNNGYSQNNSIKKDTLFLSSEKVAYIDTVKLVFVNGEYLKSFDIVLMQPLTKSEIRNIEDYVIENNGICVIRYKERFDKFVSGNGENLESVDTDFTHAEKSKLAGYYLTESGQCKNTSLTFALLGGVGGSAVIYFINPLLGIGVSSVCGIISIVQNYQGNNYLQKAGELMMK